MDTADNMFESRIGKDGGVIPPICHLRSIDEIPERYRNIFRQYSNFNAVQSAVLDKVLYTDEPVVVCAPTGSGKTVIFELSIIRLLRKLEGRRLENNFNQQDHFKIVYLAPVKALCTERASDWKEKFAPLGLNCAEVTGDTDYGKDLLCIKHYQLIVTTPEKWDYITREWKHREMLVRTIKLFLIDEVHLLNEDTRGSTLEAVVCRMKTVQQTLRRNEGNRRDGDELRFLAISATIPNVKDIAIWLGPDATQPAFFCKAKENTRPVKLRKIISGYAYGEKQNTYHFEVNLSYKLKPIIDQYANGKPTLIFCSTRNGVMQTCKILKENNCGFMKCSDEQMEGIANELQHILDSKIKELLCIGIGCHHAGMAFPDRLAVENLFRNGYLPILVATTTLAMGVNLPAHLVIIKGTEQYIQGVGYQEYSEGQMLQMMGRAGRPQFDITATVAIMTKQSNVKKYEKFFRSEDLIESNLHKHLPEHLNAEVVLKTITDMDVAMQWIRSTFLYIRACKNPTHYAITAESQSELQIESHLQDLCVKKLKELAEFDVIQMENGYDIYPKENGILMAKYYMTFSTVKLFTRVQGTERLEELLELLVQANEFSDLTLRMNERTTLNTLNCSKIRDIKKKGGKQGDGTEPQSPVLKNCESKVIRFKLDGKIKTLPAKINCLIQCTLGCLHISDFSLQQDATKILRTAYRLVQGLKQYLWAKPYYEALRSCCLLLKCLHCHLWENSPYVCRQLFGIGVTYGTALVAAGYTTFQSLASANPRDLEMIVHRNPPWGNMMQENISAKVPYYSLEAVLNNEEHSLKIEITLKNHSLMGFGEKGPVTQLNGSCSLLVGCSQNQLIHKQKITERQLVKIGGIFRTAVDLNKMTAKEFLKVSLISDNWVGVDVETTIDLSSGVVTPGNVSQMHEANVPESTAFKTKTMKKKSERRTKKADVDHKTTDEIVTDYKKHFQEKEKFEIVRNSGSENGNEFEDIGAWENKTANVDTSVVLLNGKGETKNNSKGKSSRQLSIDMFFPAVRSKCNGLQANVALMPTMKKAEMNETNKEIVKNLRPITDTVVIEAPINESQDHYSAVDLFSSESEMEESRVVPLKDDHSKVQELQAEENETKREVAVILEEDPVNENFERRLQQIGLPQNGMNGITIATAVSSFEDMFLNIPGGNVSNAHLPNGNNEGWNAFQDDGESMQRSRSNPSGNENFIDKIKHNLRMFGNDGKAFSGREFYSFKREANTNGNSIRLVKKSPAKGRMPMPIPETPAVKRDRTLSIFSDRFEAFANASTFAKRGRMERPKSVKNCNYFRPNGNLEQSQRFLKTFFTPIAKQKIPPTVEEQYLRRVGISEKCEIQLQERFPEEVLEFQQDCKQKGIQQESIMQPMQPPPFLDFEFFVDEDEPKDAPLDHVHHPNHICRDCNHEMSNGRTDAAPTFQSYSAPSYTWNSGSGFPPIQPYGPYFPRPDRSFPMAPYSPQPQLPPPYGGRIPGNGYPMPFHLRSFNPNSGYPPACTTSRPVAYNKNTRSWEYIFH